MSHKMCMSMSVCVCVCVLLPTLCTFNVTADRGKNVTQFAFVHHLKNDKY